MEIEQNIEFKPGEIRCPRCKCKDIVHSMPRGIKDDIMYGMGRVPRHCRKCGKRFYIKVDLPQEVDEDEDMQQGAGA